MNLRVRVESNGENAEVDDVTYYQISGGRRDLGSSDLSRNERTMCEILFQRKALRGEIGDRQPTLVRLCVVMKKEGWT